MIAVEEQQDTSTGFLTVRDDTGWQVESDRLYRLVTIRDMTSQEIDDRHTNRATNIMTSTEGKLHKLEFAALYWLATQHNPNLTVDQFLSQLDNFASQFDDQKFKNKIKEIL